MASYPLLRTECLPLLYAHFYNSDCDYAVQALVDVASKAQRAQWKLEKAPVHKLSGVPCMWTSDFHTEASSPCIDSAGGDCDLISSALVIFSVESSCVNVSENRALGHT